VGGGETAPSSLYRGLGKRSSAKEIVRWLSVRLAKIDPLVRKTAAPAVKIVATSEETKRLMPRGAQAKTVVYPAIGLRVKDLEIEAGRAVTERHCGGRLLFVGRLIPWKGCSFAVKALASAVQRGVDATLTVAGDGPERESLEALARDLGVQDRVDFLGTVPRARVLELCRSHDAFIFPSLHDSGGIAVLEAMYLGLPVVCLDLGGPAVSVDDAGIRIKCENSGQVVADLSRAIERLTTDADLRERLIKAARQRVIDHYDWDHKASYIAELYETALTP
jgi:glycosyltransferase involved in cell wall biosynthesis